MSSLSDDQIKYARYKWEFLRRNPEYVKDWKNLTDVLTEKYGGLWSPSDTEMSKEEAEFCKKWKIACQLPPHNSYDDYTDYISKRHPIHEENGIDFNFMPISINRFTRGIDLHRIMFDRLFPKFLHLRSFELVDGWEYEYDEDFGPMQRFSDKVAKSGLLNVRIDLNHSKNRLINDFKQFIGEWKKMYEAAFLNEQYRKFCEEREISMHPVDLELQKEFKKMYANKLKERKGLYEKKYHFDNYDLYLQVYDLRREGLSWKEVTNELNLNSIQTARNHYNAACELIEKGVELYVK